MAPSVVAEARQSLFIPPRARVYDPSLLDIDYLSIRWTRNVPTTSLFGHLFIYNPLARVSYPRMVALPSDQAARTAIIENLPTTLHTEFDLSNPHGHVLTNTIVVEVAGALSEVSATDSRGKRFRVQWPHWCVNFGPPRCENNAGSTVPEKYAILPTTEEHVSTSTCERFAELFSIAKALDKALKLLSQRDNRYIHIDTSIERESPYRLSQEVLSDVMHVDQFVIIISDYLLMKWLGEDMLGQGTWEVVERLFVDDELSKIGTEGKKAMHLVVWVRAMIQELEENLGVFVLFWGIHDAASWLIERKENPGSVQVRSPSPELPALRKLRVACNAQSNPQDQKAIRHPHKAQNDQPDIFGYISSSLHLQPRSVSGTPSCSPSYSQPSTVKYNNATQPLNDIDYILNKYLPTECGDRPFATDKDILQKQLQVLHPLQAARGQKRKHQCTITRKNSAPRVLERKTRSVIVDVPVDHDGKELDRKLVKGRWKGPKIRKVVQVDVGSSNFPFGDDGAENLNYGSDMNQSSRETSLEDLSSAGEVIKAARTVASQSLVKSALDFVKDKNYDTSDTIDDGQQTPPTSPSSRKKRRVIKSSVARRIQPKRGHLPDLPKLVVWDPATSSPLKQN
ncbi:hypothetical protein BDZ91DRAFT_793326 [Kalaharituber pfeilii]|nr:hypothetical protein BDZ91DRAFT_793326 [Kalaharituber pfeilii]